MKVFFSNMKLMLCKVKNKQVWKKLIVSETKIKTTVNCNGKIWYLNINKFLLIIMVCLISYNHNYFYYENYFYFSSEI